MLPRFQTMWIPRKLPEPGNDKGDGGKCKREVTESGFQVSGEKDSAAGNKV
jgi:hypothetical protein